MKVVPDRLLCCVLKCPHIGMSQRVSSIGTAILIVSFIAEEATIVAHIRIEARKRLVAHSPFHLLSSDLEFPTTNLLFNLECDSTEQGFVSILFYVVPGFHTAQAGLKFLELLRAFCLYLRPDPEVLRLQDCPIILSLFGPGVQVQGFLYTKQVLSRLSGILTLSKSFNEVIKVK